MAAILHADNPYRDSFACDIMEAVRPDVDAWLLEYGENHRITSIDFYEEKGWRDQVNA
jgi:CRISPR/Cas system-associated endonuclease Cas1